MWDLSGMTLWLLALMMDDVISGRVEPAKVSSECRAITDAHGLIPTALLQLRWRIVDEEQPEPAAVVPLKERSGRLRVLNRARARAVRGRRQVRDRRAHYGARFER
jgi:hypothetical protein